MAKPNVAEAFKSGLEVEGAFIELKALVDAFRGFADGSDSPVVFVVDKAVERLGLSLQSHQFVLADLQKLEQAALS